MDADLCGEGKAAIPSLRPGLNGPQQEPHPSVLLTKRHCKAPARETQNKAGGRTEAESYMRTRRAECAGRTPQHASLPLLLKHVKNKTSQI